MYVKPYLRSRIFEREKFRISLSTEVRTSFLAGKRSTRFATNSFVNRLKVRSYACAYFCVEVNTILLSSKLTIYC